MKLKVLCTTAALAFAGLVLGVSVPADAAQPDKPKRQKPRQVLPTGAEDAAPTTAAEDAAEQALERMTSRSTEGLTLRELPNGAEMLDLEGRFMHVSRVVTRPDGSKAVVCSTGHDHGSKAAPVAPAKGPAVLEEK